MIKYEIINNKLINECIIVTYAKYFNNFIDF